MTTGARLARTVLDQLHMRAALVAPRYAGMADARDGVSVVGLFSDVRELAQTDVEAEVGKVALHRAQLASAYGVSDVSQKPFVFANGKAIIPIHGLLLNRFSWSWGFVTGYNFIREQVAAALADPDVDGIVYDVNTYGGMVAGCQETADAIYAASEHGGTGGKPSLAVIDSSCYSAGYYLMCGVDSIAVTPTGGVGSIGVMMLHMDMSKMLDEIGVKMTLLFVGDHKVDGNPYEPLPPDVSADLMADLQQMYEKFVLTVSTYRPQLSEEDVRGTQARCYLADDALAIGLVDSIETPPNAISSYFSDDEEDETDQPEAIDPTSVIDDDDEPDDAGDDDEDGTDIDDPDSEEDPTHRTQELVTMAATTIAAAPAAQTPAVDTAALAAAARNEERARVQGIVGHAEAAGREELAQHLAFGTDLGVDAAAAILKASPKKAAAPAPANTNANAQPKASPFLAAMQRSDHPNVGPSQGDGEGDTGGGGEMSVAQRVLAAQRKASGGTTDPAARRLSPQQMLEHSRQARR